MKEVYIEGIGKCYDVDCVADCLFLIIGIGFDYQIDNKRKICRS